ncbi:hypothetical protein J3D54_003782 [Pseudomonas sp. GGS8]|nr:hypothetical protein [Pseudomonas sp. GGS8]
MTSTFKLPIHFVQQHVRQPTATAGRLAAPRSGFSRPRHDQRSRLQMRPNQPGNRISTRKIAPILGAQQKQFDLSSSLLCRPKTLAIFVDERRNKGKRGGLKVIYYWQLAKLT